jgi:CHAT domain-containing protein
MIADRLGPTFEEHGFDVDRGSTLPEGLSGSELAVVAAHGSIVPEGSYFQLVSNDADLRVAASDFANVLRNVGVVILFVCSGGRADKHPSSNTIVGLAKQLLDQGCSAVIASPWPLDARVTYHWLPEFLTVWTQGTPLIDANFAANNAVKRGLGDDPARCLAMSVYGDPLRMRAS